MSVISSKSELFVKSVTYDHRAIYDDAPSVNKCTIFAMFFKSYGAQNGARKNYPNLAPVSDLFRGTTSL